MGTPASIRPTKAQWSCRRGALLALALAHAAVAPAVARDLRARRSGLEPAQRKGGRLVQRHETLPRAYERREGRLAERRESSPRQDRHFIEDRLSATRRALAAAQTNLAELERSSGEFDDDDVEDDGSEAPVSDAMHLSAQPVQPAFSPSDGVEVAHRRLQGSGRPERSGHSEDYNRETEIHDEIPWSYEQVVAAAFICTIVAGPVVIQYYTHEKATRTVIMQSVLTVIVLLGAMYAFCNVLVFHSSHFSGHRSLTIVECVYLMSQIITTVGYGDIVPADSMSQVVVGSFVLLSLFLIVDMVSQVSRMVIDRVENYSQELTEEVFDNMTNPDAEELGEASPMSSFGDALSGPWGNSSPFFQAPEVTLISFVSTLVVLLFFVFAGVLFFRFYPGEGKTWFQAVYMSIVTLSTTGFGAFTAVTTGGQVFSAFWMIFGVAALMSFVCAFAEVMMKLKEMERHNSVAVKMQMDDNLEKVGQRHQGKLNSVEFLRFAVLQLRIASDDQLESIEAWFDELNPDRHGRVHLSTLDQRIKMEGSAA